MTLWNSLLPASEVLGILLALYWVLVIITIVAEDREPTTTLAWILVLALLPMVGIAAYIIVGRDWKHRVPKQKKTIRAKAIALACMNRHHEPYRKLQDVMLARTDDTVTERVTRSITAENDSRPLPVRSLDIFNAGDEFFGQLMYDIAAAQRFVHMQYFIWEHDDLTAKIVELLIERAKAGVEVRITYDWFGSLLYSKRQLDELRRAGGDVRADERQLTSLNYRNHRKITVIDGDIGYTGGHNIGQEYIDGGKNYPAWRDTSARITGPGVALLQKWFAYRWLTSFGEDELFEDRYFPAPDPKLTTGRPLMIGVVAQGVDDPWESARRTHMVAIAGAARIMRIQSPYFVPDVGIYDSMINAALAGVEVHFMMTGWPDKRYAFWTAQSYWRRLIEAGGRVYTYQAGFLHSKTIAIDSQLCAVGTMNMDLRSLRLQRELMMWVYDAKRTLEVERAFDEDLKHCTEITLEDVDAMNWALRFRNSASRLAANLL